MLSDNIVLRWFFLYLAPSRTVNITAVVVKNLIYPLILSCDLLRRLGVDIMWSKDILMWGELFTPIIYKNSLTIATTDLWEKRTAQIQPSHYEDAEPEELVPLHLDEHQKHQLLTLFRRFKKLFREVLGEVKRFVYKPVIKVNITPYHAKPYSVPVAYEETFKTELDRLERLGIIEKAKRTEWAAPCFIVPKKNKAP